ncbi:MAG TPA: glycerol kinase GlpK [Candidatus Ornithoclostridium excrementipullorum]|nr:glycerol kinase GlpK [Candidatus Ornithoclostridium excrementipullorum]
MTGYVIAIDQGTTSSRAIAFGEDGTVAAKAQYPFRQIYPGAGWVEHDPEDIYGTSLRALRETVAAVGADNVAAIGITNQRETTVVWDKRSGHAVYNAIVWQCRRTADYCDKLKETGVDSLIYDRTGLQVDPYFSATKIKWILDNVKGARERAENGDLLFGTVDTYLMWRLSRGGIFATDYTNAARTMLFDIDTLRWDAELCDMFGVPSSMLPQVFPSGHAYGVTDKNETGAEIPICAVAGDQQAALFGHLCTRKGDIKNTYGTGCFTLMNTGEQRLRSKRGLLTTLAATAEGQPPQYVLEGSVFIGGAVIQWLRDELGMVETAAETEEIAKSVPDTGGVYIVPAFVGLGAPHWDAKARGIVCGITRGTGRAHFVRAALESIAYQVVDVMHAMESDAGCDIAKLAVDGGACANDFLMQFQADVLGCEVERPAVTETTALGAAYLAGLTAGVWKDLGQIASGRKTDRVFRPEMSVKRRKELLLGWAQSIGRARYR